eukprot:SRR837773.26764.p2 GENE.SRR837773.26764~~SRR837773.26764.p2  ORF type:complete len:101 (-),score=42.10 SRR837773.26764:206-475(-)
MGVCDEALEDEALVDMIVQMGTKLHDDPGADQGVTQMHGVHTDKERQRACSKLKDWMLADPVCAEWMAADAAASANVLLRDMDAKGKKR